MRIRVNFERPGEIFYLGYIDLKTTIERGLRRTSLPLTFTEGYTPRVKMEMGFPLSVGMIGEDEYFDFYIEENMQLDAILNALSHSFANILRIKDIKSISDTVPPISSLRAILVNFLYGHLDFDIPDEEVESSIRNILKADKIIIERSKGKKEIREFIENVELMKREGLQYEFLFSVYFTERGSIRLDEMVTVLNIHNIPFLLDYAVRKKTSVFYKGRIISPMDF